MVLEEELIGLIHGRFAKPEEELRGSGSTIGYRQMTQRLVVDHGLVVGKETVRELVKILKKSVRPTCNFFVL